MPAIHIVIDPGEWQRRARNAGLTAFEQGVLLQLYLLAAEEHDSSLPISDRELATLLGLTAQEWTGSRLWANFEQWFSADSRRGERRWVCTEVEQERQRREAAREAARKGGRASGEARSRKRKLRTPPIMAAAAALFQTNCTSELHFNPIEVQFNPIEVRFEALEPHFGSAVQDAAAGAARGDTAGTHTGSTDPTTTAGPPAPLETDLSNHPSRCGPRAATSRDAGGCARGSTSGDRPAAILGQSAAASATMGRPLLPTPPPKGTSPTAPAGVYVPPRSPPHREDFSLSAEDSAQGGGGPGEGPPAGGWTVASYKAAAERVVEHYQATVQPRRRATDGAYRNVAALLKKGIPEESLTRAADHYAAECCALRTGADMRRSARNFFGSRDGYWRQYERGEDPRPVSDTADRLQRLRQQQEEQRQLEASQQGRRRQLEAAWERLDHERRRAIEERVAQQHPEHRGRAALLRSLCLKELEGATPP